MEEDQLVSAYIVGEDPSYPTLVLQGEFGSIGYSVCPRTGDLSRVCICAARSEHECCCGYDLYHNNYNTIYVTEDAFNIIQELNEDKTLRPSEFLLNVARQLDEGGF